MIQEDKIPKIFISYSWVNSELVLELAQKESIGKCVYDRKIIYSGSWSAAPAILNAIKVDEIGTLN